MQVVTPERFCKVTFTFSPPHDHSPRQLQNINAPPIVALNLEHGSYDVRALDHYHGKFLLLKISAQNFHKYLVTDSILS